MALTQRLMQSPERRSTPDGKIMGPIDIRDIDLRDPSIWQNIIFGDAQPSLTGMHITPERSMGLAAVLNAVTLIAGTVGSLPLPVFQWGENGGKIRAVDHPLYPVLHNKPNRIMIPMVFWELMMVGLLLRGNAYAEKEFNSYMDVVALWPIPSNRVKPSAIEDGRGGIAYEITRKSGQMYKATDATIFHIPGLGFDGVEGKSPVTLAREAIALGIAGESVAAKMFANGLKPSVTLKMPEKFESLSENARKNLQQDFSDKYGGVENTGKPMILEDGWDMTAFTIPPADAQFIENRKFQVEEVARMFNCPPHKLKELSRATFSNIEQQNNEFTMDCIRPWLVRLEQSMTLQLFRMADQNSYFAKFDMDELQRGDQASRGAFYECLWRMGALNADEAREREDFNPKDQKSPYYVPVNYMPEGQAQAPTNEPPTGPDDLQNNAEPPKTESRSAEQRRSSAQRITIRNSYRRIFADAGARVMRGEKRNVMNAVKKYGDDQAKLLGWMDNYYRNDHQAFIKKEFAGPFYSLAEAIQPVAAERVNYTEDITPRVQRAVHDHLDGFAYRQSLYSLNALTELVKAKRSTRDDGEEAELSDDFEERLDSWGEQRPDAMSRWETVRTDGMVAALIFAAAGFAALVWACNSEKPCAACEEMDGTEVRNGDSFMSSDATMIVDGADFSPSWDVVTPPIHDCCGCSVEPA